MQEKIKNIVSNIAHKASEFVSNNSEAILLGITVMGSLFVYNKIFDYGYDCRKNFEAACDADTGSKIIETLNKYNN